jgi:acyl-CoA synthetase (AMP-forming)/AMP-acid ligase II
MTKQWTLGAVLDAIADADPDRMMTVCGGRKSTFGEAAIRTRRLANLLADRGFGAHRERSELNPWECGQDRVALVMHNDLYVEAMIGCLKARVVPVNVNHHYSAREVHDLLDYVRPRGIIYHKSLGPLVRAARPGAATELLLSIDDSAEDELGGAISFDAAVSAGADDRVIDTSPDDLLMVCTGGTTGRPKGVLWRQGDVYVSSMGGADHPTAESIAGGLCDARQRWFAVSPLMHAAGIWTTFAAVLGGRTVLVYDNRHKFDPRDVLETAARERVAMLTIVGDAYAGPLVAELERRSYDLSSLTAIGTGEVDGQRVVVPGDRARFEADGSIRLFGRDSLVVNTGGEKVFVEEVEEVLRAHPDIADALVVGRPSERWGEEVVALVALHPGVEVGADALHGLCTSQLARFKAPKAFLFVDEVRRLGNGKPDYRWAKRHAASMVPTGGIL